MNNDNSTTDPYAEFAKKQADALRALLGHVIDADDDDKNTDTEEVTA